MLILTMDDGYTTAKMTKVVLAVWWHHYQPRVELLHAQRFNFSTPSSLAEWTK